MLRTALVFTISLPLAAVATHNARADPFAGLGLSRPAQACRPYRHDMRAPGLWLGHFSGGALVRPESGDPFLAWRDAYACFTTATACELWQRRLSAHYVVKQGYSACIPLRGGGETSRPRTGVVKAKY